MSLKTNVHFHVASGKTDTTYITIKPYSFTNAESEAKEVIVVAYMKWRLDPSIGQHV